MEDDGIFDNLSPLPAGVSGHLLEFRLHIGR
jgi:hypothetical protein